MHAQTGRHEFPDGTTEPMVGQTVSHYRILERLGAGAMGVVYRAEDTRLDRLVALKFLPEEFTRDPHAVERLHREARAASSLHHQNIRTIFAFDEYEGRQFIVMELLEGCALDHVIGAQPVALPTLLNFALQITDALDVAHARGVVHRDIKPANMFVTQAGVVKVLDFGLAKTLDIVPNGRASGDSQPTMLPLTMSGTSVGTAGYMSPEQVAVSTGRCNVSSKHL
jgi:serine/threonine protein kinase